MAILITLFSLISFNSFGAMPEGVEWHKGTVKAALKQAQKENRPLFLYWGAVWCPPCNQIKKTIFTQKEFHQEAKSFINVYLDGDLPNAQKWGEHFKTTGYPTMLILNSAGQEITRMPSGLNVNQYVELMKSSRTNQLTIEELFNKVKSKKAKLQDFERLAGYSWAQDKKLQDSLLSKDNETKTYQTLYHRAPVEPKHIKAQFFFRYLRSKIKQDKNYRASKDEVKTFVNFLNNNNIVTRNIELLIYYPTQYQDLFSQNLGKENFKSTYLNAIKKVRENSTIDINLRFSTLYPEIVLNKKDKKIPTKIKKEVQTWAKRIDKESKDKFSRQSNITTAIWLLKSANLLQEAKTMALAELNKSISPYYIMRYLASIESSLNNKTESLKWTRKAWQTAKGQSTRFEWGTSYLLKLLKDHPKKSQEITTVTEKVFKELLVNGDAFEGRNKKRLGRLKKQFATWKKSHTNDFYGLSANLNNNCQQAQEKRIKKLCLNWVKRL